MYFYIFKISCIILKSEEAADRPQYQALVDPLQSDETSDSKQEELPVHQQSTRNAESQTTGNDQPTTPIQMKLPLELDFEEIIGVRLWNNRWSLKGIGKNNHWIY